MERKQFSEKVNKFLEEKFPGVDIYSLSLDELKLMKENVEELYEENSMLELGSKLLNNAAYGACANPFFYWFDPNLAADITGEARNLTKYMWNKLEDFFHNEIWDRKDLWKKFNFELDPSKKEWFSKQHTSVYSDTDSTKNNAKVIIDANNFMTIEDLFNICNKESGICHTSEYSQEFVKGNGHTIKNYKDGKIVDVPIKYVMRHNTNKKMYKIRSKSGKEIIVTEDHSCVVFRNGKQMSIKAKDINPKTDKILCLK